MPDTSAYDTVLVDRADDGVATVTINRPEVLNAFNEQMRRDFARLWAELRADPAVRAIVLTSAGERAFSTGLDTTERTSGSDSPWLDTAAPWAESEDPGRELGPKSNEVWKPVVAAVRGMCAGGAFYWIGECDIVLATPESTFFDPHVTYGMVAALEPISLSYRMRYSDVVRMAVMGLHERVTAETARESGLVSEVVEAESLLDRAHELAATIASQPPAAVQGTIKALWRSRDLGREQAMASALMYTQIGNPIGVDGLDWAAAKPKKWTAR
ncbi:enoyl-CoA hydratase/isomerase family protein [Pseudonocardia halophobica]|uniref:Enoyl-CoA hydratase n=1 Tax=Pseudonocardia halophobica TaxID=29401 RepID=A0A9W6NYI4_9PSEU|nr:enoyl-CoA hydratase/isomerase family protein [Pseudonocardia halophobica]GLL13828.1 enoyl-CoA hydratase [Pseudonocardia halophobica]